MDVKEQFRAVWGIARESGICQDEFEPWHECFKASTIWPIGSRSGEMIGAVMFHGMPDASIMMHVVVKPEWEGKWLNKSILKAFKGWQPGVSIVALAADGAREKALKRFGFTPIDKEPLLGFTWFVRK